MIYLASAIVASNDVWAVGNKVAWKRWRSTGMAQAGASSRRRLFDPNATNQVLVGIVALSSDEISTAGQYIVPLQGQCPAYFDRKLGLA